MGSHTVRPGHNNLDSSDTKGLFLKADNLIGLHSLFCTAIYLLKLTIGLQGHFVADAQHVRCYWENKATLQSVVAVEASKQWANNGFWSNTDLKLRWQ